MIHDILFSLWFFIPGGIANSSPIIAAHLPGLRALKAPLDFGKKLRGKRIFGAHKTIRGLFVGVALGVLVVWLQTFAYHHYSWIRQVSAPLDYSHLSVLGFGLLLGFGALMGDALESCLKRQCNIAAGSTWFPFDQLDFVIGGLVFTALYIRLPAVYYGWILLVWFGMHILFSYLGYLVKLKERPV